MRVAIVNVGDEVLAGDTVNTNATWLASRLGERGADVERMVVIPDEVDEIASTVRRYSDSFDAVIVTGGLGPTHDDLTMEGVAEAFGTSVETNDEALEQIRETRNYSGGLAEGTADLPAGCRPLHNPEGVAPGCVVRNVYVLPGVPDEMKAMFEDIEDDFEGDVKQSVFVYTQLPESQLVGVFDELHERFDISVGSYPQDGEVRVKITSVDGDEVERARDWFVEKTDEHDRRNS